MGKSTIEYIESHGTNMLSHKFNNRFTKEMGERWTRDGCVHLSYLYIHYGFECIYKYERWYTSILCPSLSTN